MPQTLRYRTSHWDTLSKETRDLDPEFAKHLRELARPRQIAFQRLMAAYAGNPAGVECKSESREAWAFMLEDVSGEYPWRIQYFDADGFSGHTCYHSLQQAAETLIGDGYRAPDPGALDRVSGTLRWAIGHKKMEVRQLFNQGKLDWRTLLDRMHQIDLEMQPEGRAAL